MGLVNSKVRQCHKFKSIELDVFKNDLRELFANKTQDKNNLDGMLAAYFEGIKGVVYKHTPLKRCRVPDKLQKPSFPDGISPGNPNQMKD